MPRVLTLPPRGRLLVATDLQGNLDDFERIAARFEQAYQRDPDGATLLITGDLVHGPVIPRQRWPEYLGTYYEDASVQLLGRAAQLAEAYPGRVHYLLGNHEHAHIGGPVVAKFFPDEAQRLEGLLGEEATETLHRWLRTWAWVAVSPSARLLFMHAAPHAALKSASDLERMSLDEGFDAPLDELASRGALGALFWARATSPQRAKRFLQLFGRELRVAVHGHEVVRSGFALGGDVLVCMSSSFGCHNGDKVYIDWDLARPVDDAWQLISTGLRRLWPEAPRVHQAGAEALPVLAATG